MLGHLSTRTRGFVQQLINGDSATIGGQRVGPFAESQREVLKIIAVNVAVLTEKKGAELISELGRLIASAATAGNTSDPASASAPSPPRKVGTIRATSFRGIAPAGVVWEYDFESKSHLLHGPNGCGKSSLFGALCWCLTGRLFRDDGPPSFPEDIPYYSRGTKPKAEGTRPDALSLINKDGTLSSPTTAYSVDVELVSTRDSTDRIWVRRHSHNGLASSSDGHTWSQLASLSDLGISELDVELYVLVPCKVGHIRFGKNSEALGLFSQLVGLDDLELIADIAGKCHTALVKEANAIEKNELKEQLQQIIKSVAAIEQLAPQHIKELPAFEPAIVASRTASTIASLGTDIDTRGSHLRAQLASDLDITVQPTESVEAQAVAQQLDLLPGHIDSATTTLALPLAQLFPTSLGLVPRSAEDIATDIIALTAFVDTAKAQMSQRLEWALRERESSNAVLMLHAAEQFPPESNQCPVCGQDLSPVPEVEAELASLRSLASQPHLKQALDDLERALLASLDQIVSSRKRENAKSDLPTRLQSDWTSLKTSRFLGLVKALAERFDANIASTVTTVAPGPCAAVTLLTEHQTHPFPDSFSLLIPAVRNAELALALDGERSKHDSTLTTILTGALIDGPISLAGILQRGRQTNLHIKELASVRSQVTMLHRTQVKADSLKDKIRQLKEQSAASAATKDLSDHVRQETINVVKDVEPTMKAFYERLYDDERLTLDLVTPGHAANPSVKDEFNIYLRAGTARMPAAPFSNAGRLRALALCFSFSLHRRSQGTLAFTLLDDPAVSLDDEHKARFIDHLVCPNMPEQQILLATHYEHFYKCAEPRFLSEERLQLNPRRSVDDAISFEPADLLLRVERELAAQSTRWREMAINLRRWGERVLAALSGHCPTPFAIFNNLPGTIDAYANIVDLRVATARRDKIVTALRSAEFARIMHKVAHDSEVVIRTDVKDGLDALMTCKKDAEAELERFRDLLRHELLKRHISPRTPLGVLQVDMKSPAVEVAITGRAAAASNRVGITWVEPESLGLPQCQVIVVKEQVLAPIAYLGNILLLDDSDTLPLDADLVAVRSNDGSQYIRRLWKNDGFVNLEATNPTSPFHPIILPADQCEARRIVGVLFESMRCNPGGIGNEWFKPTGLRASLVSGLSGIRVDGTSLEPIARDGQVVLVREVTGLNDLGHGDLACLDIEEVGAVLKRCYSFGSQWVLCPVNPVDVEEPIVAASSAINHAYKIVGVLFEPLSSES